MSRTLKDERGVLHLPMAACLGLALLTSIGLLGVLHRWRELAELQLRLDRCAGRIAAELEETLNALEAGNARMAALRVSIAAAAPFGAATAALRSALAAEAAAQDLQRGGWSLRQAGWIASRGCDGKRDLAAPLPALPWMRDPPDALGPRPLSRPFSQIEGQTRLSIRIFHPPRAIAAEVSDTKGVMGDETHRWTARWARPGRPDFP